jgi:hypothetical protein
MYKINGVQLRKPTEGRWTNKKEQGHTGDGKPVYGAYRNFELTWDFLMPSEFGLIESAFLFSQNSGSVVVELPKYADEFVAREYSGCYLNSPEVGEYFEGYYSDVVLVVTKVVA